jgi:transcriptional regulator with XRE-family HTH domain
MSEPEQANPFVTWRAALGPDVTQRDIARQIDCTAALVSAWENVICAPTEAYQPRVAEVYQKSPDEIATAVEWIWTERARRKAETQEKEKPVRRGGKRRGFQVW